MVSSYGSAAFSTCTAPHLGVLRARADEVPRLPAREAHGECEVGVGLLAVARAVILRAAVVARLLPALAPLRAALGHAAVAQGVARAAAPEADQLAVFVLVVRGGVRRVERGWTFNFAGCRALRSLKK